MVDRISRRKLDGPITYNLRSLILVKFTSMFVCNTTGVKVNTFRCRLPLPLTTHPGIPKPKDFLNVYFFFSESHFCIPKIGVIPKRNLGRTGEVSFGKEEDFHLDLYCLISTWISNWISAWISTWIYTWIYIWISTWISI